MRAHANFILKELHAHYVMTVKENTKNLFDQFNALGLEQRTDLGRHHRHGPRATGEAHHPGDGRACRSGFPRTAQGYLLERYTDRTVGKRPHAAVTETVRVRTAVAVLGITSLSARETAPARLATYVADGGRSRADPLGFVMSRSVRMRPRSTPPPDPA